MDATSPPFGSSGPALGLSWTLLGCLFGQLLGALGRFLNAFFLPGIPRASILEGFGAGRAWFWKASGAYFGMRFAAPRTLKPNACIQCRNHVFFVSRRFAFFPCRCGGQCAAHGIIFVFGAAGDRGKNTCRRRYPKQLAS